MLEGGAALVDVAAAVSAKLAVVDVVVLSTLVACADEADVVVTAAGVDRFNNEVALVGAGLFFGVYHLLLQLLCLRLVGIVVVVVVVLIAWVLAFVG